MTPEKKRELQRLALDIKMATVECIKSKGVGHIGGSLSIGDVLAVLYGEIMNVDPDDPGDIHRDKLVVSKGHAGPAVYGALAVKGFFPYENLKTLNQNGTSLPSHCDSKLTPGVDMTTGSLGQGTSMALGLALGDRYQGRSSVTYLIVGDGEADEGQVWEAAAFASSKKITNCVWIIDWNKKQLDGYVKDIMDHVDLEGKFRAFGFDAVTVDGHDVEQIYDALTGVSDDAPRAVILDTVKGKGVRQIEETMDNHSMSAAPEVFDSWIAELKEQKEQLEALEA